MCQLGAAWRALFVAKGAEGPPDARRTEHTGLVIQDHLLGDNKTQFRVGSTPAPNVSTSSPKVPMCC